MPNKRRKTNPHKSETLEAEEVDLISCLPDSVLCHILSKLNTNSAISTTLLSTRWKHLFSQIPNLKLSIHDCLFSHHHSNFILFMRYLISTHLPHVTRLNRLVLDFDWPYPAEETNYWVSALSTLNMSEFWILCREKSRADVSSHTVFRSASLERLVLGYVNFLKTIYSFVYLPNLKTLTLIHVTFPDGDSLERAVSACPVLNSLALSNCKIATAVRVLCISSPSVKNVKLRMMSNCCDDDKCALELDMPALESLDYEDHVPERYNFKNFSPVRKASIDLRPTREQLRGDAENMWLRFRNIGDFVKACSCVSSLHLSNVTVMALSCLSRPLPSLCNLKELTLTEISPIGCGLLPQFLESAPNLEVLVFQGGFSDYNRLFSNFQRSRLEHVPMCLTLHLQTIKLEKFKGEEDEMSLVNYFLEQAHVLRNIEICFSHSVATEKLRHTKSHLWTLRHNSNKCQVDFLFDVEIDYTKFYPCEERH